mmetsp:Transcript_121569/g.344486  ORF Transcript_121569/g.344486 Transcript_121569/m.344486 type:complete len:241 (-) Transcript_121569:155-877(-)
MPAKTIATPAHANGGIECPFRAMDSSTENIFRVVVIAATFSGPNLASVKNTKNCPTAEHAANNEILVRITGFRATNPTPVVNSPEQPATTTAIAVMKKLVQNMSSYGFWGVSEILHCLLSLDWTPPVQPSSASDAKMYAKPTRVDAAPPSPALVETMAVPAMMATTWAYSRTEYLSPPRKRVPTITGAIFADLARVTTGKERLLERATNVHTFAASCVTPLMANRSRGRPRVLPDSIIPR